MTYRTTSWRVVMALLVLLIGCGCSAQQTGSTASPKKGKPSQPRVQQVSEEPNGSSLNISCANAAVDLLLVDPAGRKSGDDPVHHASFNQIPKSSYDVEGDDPDSARVLSISQPAKGTYRLSIFGNRSGEYEVEMLAVNRKGKTARQTLTGELQQGKVKRITLDFDAESDAPLTVRTRAN